jgi:K+-transporting ATPase KdpF subunit
MPASAGDSERFAMPEPIIGLTVAVVLGAYLAYTLLHPEKF